MLNLSINNISVKDIKDLLYDKITVPIYGWALTKK